MTMEAVKAEIVRLQQQVSRHEHGAQVAKARLLQLQRIVKQ